MAGVVRAWDAQRLTYRATGQRCARFEADDELSTQTPLRAGGRDWEVLAAPGHDPDSVMLFDRTHGVLISADALWENGFGVVFPELEGEPGFDDVGAVLEQIASLPVRVVIPGHGAPFSDVAGALERARRRLAGFRADPQRHAQYAVKVLIKYHLMEERRQGVQDLLHWAAHTPYLHALWERYGAGTGAAGSKTSPQDWAAHFVQDLTRSGAVRVEGDMVIDAAEG
jgi:glyoxylase-like metal-dependent hydrolase (beta-lactamase superfamily II)